MNGPGKQRITAPRALEAKGIEAGRAAVLHLLKTLESEELKSQAGRTAARLMPPSKLADVDKSAWRPVWHSCYGVSWNGERALTQRGINPL